MWFPQKYTTPSKAKQPTEPKTDMSDDGDETFARPSRKRRRDEVDEDGMEEPRSNKKVSTASEASGFATNVPLLNYPIYSAQSACICQVYDNAEGLKLNDLVEIVGALSLPPEADFGE